MKRLTGKRDGRTYIVGCPDFALCGARMDKEDEHE